MEEDTVLYKARAGLEIEGESGWCHGASTGAVARGQELVLNRQSKDPGQAGHMEGPRGLRRNLDKGLEENSIEDY